LDMQTILQVTGADSVAGSTSSRQEEGRGSIPTPALQALNVRPIPKLIAREVVVNHHYLHSFPGGTKLAFGIFIDNRLLGALTLGVGPKNAHCLVDGAVADDCLTLTRLWLSDDIPSNGESRVIGVILRFLRKYTDIKFLISYADPSCGHVGTIYQAACWLYTGLSEAMALFDLGDGIARHSRSVGQIFGSHSVGYLTGQGIPVKLVPQVAKYRYVYFLDKSWQSRLRVPILRYPKKEGKP
jgi:hypothetical protein